MPRYHPFQRPACLIAALFIGAITSGFALAQPASPATPATQPAATQPGESATTQRAGSDKAEKARASIAAEATLKGQRAERIAKAVKKLTEEAMDLDKFDKAASSVTFNRPHPLLAGFGPDDAKEVLGRTIGAFTGNEYRDTYIRWHLFWAVIKASDADRRYMGFDVIKLLKMVPMGLNIPEQPEYTYEPEENWHRYRAMFGHNYIPHPPIIVEGYPPFERRIGPPAVWAKLGAGSEEAYKAAVEEGKKKNEDQEKRAKAWLLIKENQYTQVYHPGARAFNYRIEAFSRITYQYRGEIIYFLMMTGDPDILRLLFREIDLAVNGKQGLAIELMQYIYLGSFDGALNLYDEGVLKEMGAMLKKTAREHEGYTVYASQNRNFADYAFHLVYLLEDGGGGLINPKEAKVIPGRRVRLNAGNP